MLKIRIFLLVILFVISQNAVWATEEIDVSSFINEVKGYTNDVFPEFTDENWLNNILERRYRDSGTRYYSKNIESFLERI